MATYNNLDTLCWAIPTRVYTANFVVIALLASAKASLTSIPYLTPTAFSILAAVNFMGASSLRRLWLDHSRMGFWLAALEAELSPKIAAGTIYIDAAGSVASYGYFTDRHSEGFGNLHTWRKSVYERSYLRFFPSEVWNAWRGVTVNRVTGEIVIRKKTIAPRLSARHTNILFMRLTGVGLLVAAVVMAIYPF